LTFIALMQNILIIAKVDACWQNIIIGVVLVAVVALDAAFNRRGWN
jgi:ribose/xylose/arabinose/galactoside ABC-type transport system permease subunit